MLSGLPPIADIHAGTRHVADVPQADIAPGCNSSATWQLRAALGGVHAITSGHPLSLPRLANIA
jgi:hypothetical protein